LSRAKPAAPACEEPSDVRHRRIIADAQTDVEVLLSYASGRVQIKLPDGLIASSVAMVRKPVDQIGEADEVLLWECLDRLTAAVNPATAASVKLVTEIETARRRAGRSGEPEGQRQVEWARRMMFALLVAVLSCQIYSGLLSSIVTNIKTHEKDLEGVKGQISRLKQMTEGKGSDQDAGGGEVLRALEEQRNNTELNLDQADVLLHHVLVPWSVLRKTPGKDPRDPMKESTKSYEFGELGQAELQALTLYVLPLLYGSLGAVAYILRRLSESIEQSTFALTAMYRYRLRLTLGALLGSTVGLFFTPGGSTLIPGLSLSVVATAFLAGYSVEVFFALFDKMIDGARTALASKSAESGARQPAQPKDPVNAAHDTPPEAPAAAGGDADPQAA